MNARQPLPDEHPAADGAAMAAAAAETGHPENHHPVGHPPEGHPPEDRHATDRHHGRLFRKYLLLMLSLVSVSLLISGAIGLYFSYQETRASLASLQHEKAVGAAARIEQYIGQASWQLLMASLTQLDAGENVARHAEFTKLLRALPELTDISLLDAAGREQVSVSRLGLDRIGPGRDRAAEPAFREARHDRPWYGPVYFRKETEPYLSVAVRGSDGGAVTVAELNLKFIWDVVSRIQVGRQGKAYVVDAQGFLVADPDIGLVLRKTSMAALPHVAAAASPDAPAMQSTDLAGRPVLTAMAPIGPLGWRVFVEQPVSEVYHRLDAAIVRTALLLLGGLVLSAVAALLLARGLVRPIRVLDEGARRIGAGELDQRIEVRTGDELEALAGQFNRMSERLRESYAGLERQVETRTAELREALGYQTAISGVLRVMSESPGDVMPVFEAILDSGMRLFGSTTAAVFRFDGTQLHLAANRNWTPQVIEHMRQRFPMPPDPALMSGRVVLQASVVVVEDAWTDEAFDRASAHLGGWRKLLGAPLLKDGAPVGAIVVAWSEPGAVPPRQVELVRTFADQAAIALENVRLFNETREALERQTATADILRVISSSVTDAQPVFDAIVASCQRLFGGGAVALAMPDGDMLTSVAFADDGSRPGAGGFHAPWPLDAHSAAGACILQARLIMVADTAEGALHYRRMRDLALAQGYRSGLFVPLLREGKALGCIAILRTVVGPFDEQQVRLARTFADQAVIALENVRLFHEIQEALDRQTATAEVLRVMSGSPTDVQPVLDTVAERSGLLCRADGSRVWLAEGGELRAMTSYGPAFPDGSRRETLPPGGGSVAGRAFLERCCVHVHDVLPLIDSEYPDIRALQASYGFRTVLAVPMLREGEAIGVIALLRNEVRPFQPAEIDLVQTFADQAVIAIENVRLFREIQEALDRQTTTAEVLKLISRSSFDLQAVLDTLIDSARRLSGADGAVLYRPDERGNYLPAIWRFWQPEPEANERYLALLRGRPIRPGRDSAAGRALLLREVVSIEDVGRDPEYGRQDMVELGRFGNVLAVPLLRQGEPIGVIALSNAAGRRPFTPTQIELVTTFADQAVIAIENARLFTEIQDKGRQLEAANRHKSEFLANMSHELRTPLNAVIGFSEVLLEQMFGELNAKQTEYLQDIHSSGQHLLALINDVLDLSKIEAGRMELDLSRFNLGLLLGHSLTLVRERATRQGLALTLEVSGDLGEWVADARKLKQVVVNLLSNAVKFTPSGGRVLLRARRDGDAALIEVVDTGVGIAPEDHDKVFEEFRQASGDYLRKAEGSGLGLALARRFVELHGGRLWLHSVPGEGSTFGFTLPLQTPTEDET